MNPEPLLAPCPVHHWNRRTAALESAGNVLRPYNRLQDSRCAFRRGSIRAPRRGW